ncbi:MAG TPA: hypothetical protein VFZ93_00950, partial [Albitalea sp.]
MGQERVEERVGTLAVVGAGGFEEGDRLGDGAAVAGEDAVEQGLVLGGEAPFGLSLSKPRCAATRPFDRLRANGAFPFGLSLS